MSYRAGKTSRGFTLIELVVCIVIIAMLSGLGLGVYASRRKSKKLYQFARQIQSVGEYARCLAVEKGINISLVLNQSQNAFLLQSRIRKDDEESELSVIEDQYCKPVKMESYIRIVNVNISRENRYENTDGKTSRELDTKELCFYPDGSSDRGEIIIGSDSKLITIYVSPANGKFTIYKGKNSKIPERPVDLDEM